MSWPSWAKCVQCWDSQKMKNPSAHYGHKDFVLLPCFHVVCNEPGGCSDAFLHSGTARCPSCQRPAQLTPSSPKIRPADFTEQTCSMCIREGKAEAYCADCDKLLCDLCMDHHPFGVSTAGHTLLPANTFDVDHCGQHGLECLYFCQTCEDLCCKDCECCGKHNVVSVEDAVSEMMGDLKDCGRHIGKSLTELGQRSVAVNQKVEQLANKEMDFLIKEASCMLTVIISKIHAREVELRNDIRARTMGTADALKAKELQATTTARSSFQYAQLLKQLLSNGGTRKSRFFQLYRLVKENYDEQKNLLSPYVGGAGDVFFQEMGHTFRMDKTMGSEVEKKLPFLCSISTTMRRPLPPSVAASVARQAQSQPQSSRAVKQDKFQPVILSAQSLAPKTQLQSQTRQYQPKPGPTRMPSGSVTIITAPNLMPSRTLHIPKKVETIRVSNSNLSIEPVMVDYEESASPPSVLSNERGSDDVEFNTMDLEETQEIDLDTLGDDGLRKLRGETPDVTVVTPAPAVVKVKANEAPTTSTSESESDENNEEDTKEDEDKEKEVIVIEDKEESIEEISNYVKSMENALSPNFIIDSKEDKSKQEEKCRENGNGNDQEELDNVDVETKQVEEEDPKGKESPVNQKEEDDEDRTTIVLSSIIDTVVEEAFAEKKKEPKDVSKAKEKVDSNDKGSQVKGSEESSEPVTKEEIQLAQTLGELSDFFEESFASNEKSEEVEAETETEKIETGMRGPFPMERYRGRRSGRISKSARVSSSEKSTSTSHPSTTTPLTRRISAAKPPGRKKVEPEAAKENAIKAVDNDTTSEGSPLLEVSTPTTSLSLYSKRIKKPKLLDDDWVSSLMLPAKRARKSKKYPDDMIVEAPNSILSNHEDYCGVCGDGGDDLLCCERCPKVVHIGCNIPPLSAIPTGTFYCNFCTSVEDARDPSKQPEFHIRLTQGIHSNEVEFFTACKILTDCYGEEAQLGLRAVFERLQALVPTKLHPLLVVRDRLTRNVPTPYANLEDFKATLIKLLEASATSAKDKKIVKASLIHKLTKIVRSSSSSPRPSPPAKK